MNLKLKRYIIYSMEIISESESLFKINDVITNEAILNNYIQELNKYNINKNKTINELIIYARNICDGLPNEKELFILLHSNNNINDKGLFGKIIEYSLFCQKPNCSSTADLISLGCDIKSCAFKTLQNNDKNAKERLTITNCGNTNNYDSFKHICDNDDFSQSKYYIKSKKFILFVRNHDKIKFKTFDEILNQTMLFIGCFNIETLPLEMKNIVKDDYNKIRQSIIEKRVSQKGQQYLHIHPHGMGHGSGTRALGFTGKFITMIVALQIARLYNKQIEDIINKTSKSISIKKEYL